MRLSLFIVALFLSFEVLAAGVQPVLASRMVNEGRVNGPVVESGNVPVEKDILENQVVSVNKPELQDVIEKQPVYDFIVYVGESYRSAISRWLWEDGVSYIAFDGSLDVVLDKAVDSKQVYPAPNVGSAIGAVLQYVGGRLTIFNGSDKAAAIHNFSKPQLHITKGKTLRDAVAGLVSFYGWNWDIKKNWLLDDDFVYEYQQVIVTENHDIAAALTKLLRGYPVRADQDHSTKQIFIVEDGTTYE